MTSADVETKDNVSYKNTNLFKEIKGKFTEVEQNLCQSIGFCQYQLKDTNESLTNHLRNIITWILTEKRVNRKYIIENYYYQIGTSWGARAVFL